MRSSLLSGLFGPFEIAAKLPSHSSMETCPSCGNKLCLSKWGCTQEMSVAECGVASAQQDIPCFGRQTRPLVNLSCSCICGLHCSAHFDGGMLSPI